jgi:hypothetical protein
MDLECGLFKSTMFWFEKRVKNCWSHSLTDCVDGAIYSVEMTFYCTRDA